MDPPSLRAVLPAWVVHMPGEDQARLDDLSRMQPTAEVMHPVRRGLFRPASPAVSDQSALESQVTVVLEHKTI